MPPKKRKGKGRKKSPKKNVDWGSVQRELFAYLEIRNSAWASMRFTQLISTSQPMEAVRKLIIERHQVVASLGLRLFLGEECTSHNEFKPEDFGLPLEELGVHGGSQNDHVHRVITYEYTPFRSILNIPRNLSLPPTQVSYTHEPPGVRPGAPLPSMPARAPSLALAARENSALGAVRST
mmetsp:Transcript_39454/g.65433  ORF Transcript_39454/g.65433 Transcript_39454/m.65433 type:complete len:180 (+) Transcript_39454:40-579(+)